MISHEDLKLRMTENQWPTEAIGLVVSAFPNIGPQTLNYLYYDCSEAAKVTIDLIVREVSNLPRWSQEVENGSVNNFSKDLARVLKTGNPILIKLVSSFIYDIHSNKGLSASLNAADNKALFLYQLPNIEELPSQEMALALNSNVVDIVEVFDLQAELKRFSFYKSYDLGDNKYNKFRLALETSEQLITDQGIQLKGGTVPGSVNNFIKDYLDAEVNIKSGYSSFGVASYVTTAPSIKVLSEGERLALRRILEAYSFLLNPTYNQSEVEAYELEREGIIELLPNIILGESVPSPQSLTPARSVVSEVSHPPRKVVSDIRPHSAPAYPASKSLEELTKTSPVASYNSPQSRANEGLTASDSAKIRDLINHQPSSLANDKRGVTMDPTNVKIDEEEKRLHKDREQQAASIQTKLSELRKRSVKQ